MRKNKKEMIMILLILVSMSFYTGLKPERTLADNPPPFFTITLLAPNTSTLRNEWIVLLPNELPKIGIGVNLTHTGWAEIYPRTWDYPGPYPIPCYLDGGYDLIVIGYGNYIDYNPIGLFDSSSIIPLGSNFYQYNNPVMDNAIADYQNAYFPDDRIALAEDIQAMLYDDLPQTSVYYPQAVYPMSLDFNQSSWDGELWQHERQPMENWSVTSSTEFHYATPADFSEFHIYHYESVFAAQWLRQIYNGLIERVPGTHKYGPRLASSYTTTDGLTWTVNINPNAKWADGTALTAQDVNYSYNLLIDPALGSPDHAYWNQYVDSESINIINDYQFQITFLKPYVFQEKNLALDIVPKHIWESINPADHETQAATWAISDPNKLMGAGPYYLEEYNTSNHVIHLTVNPYFDDWSGVTPNFNDIYFEFYSTRSGALSALSTGVIDMVDTNYDTPLDQIPTGTTYQLVNDARYEELGFNCLHPIIGTGELCPIASVDSGKHIRKAISHMIPRQTIVDDIYDGVGQPGVTAWNHIALGFDDDLDPYAYDIEEAKDHMRAAGYVYPEDIPDPTNTTTPTPTSTNVIFGFAFGSVMCTLSLVSCIVIIIQYKKRRIH